MSLRLLISSNFFITAQEIGYTNQSLQKSTSSVVVFGQQPTFQTRKILLREISRNGSSPSQYPNPVHLQSGWEPALGRVSVVVSSIFNSPRSACPQCVSSVLVDIHIPQYTDSTSATHRCHMCSHGGACVLLEWDTCIARVRRLLSSVGVSP